MTVFANALSEMLGREVVDRTGYNGTFDATLEFSSEGIATLTGGGFEASSLTPAERSDARPSIFAALEHDLGMKLVAEKGQVKVLMIDGASRPTGN